MTRAAPALAAVAVLACGCKTTVPVTEIVVAVESDLPPSRLAAVRLEVLRVPRAVDPIYRSPCVCVGGYPGCPSLPLVLGLGPSSLDRGAAGPAFTVLAHGYSDRGACARELVRQSATVQFVPGSVRLLRLDLLEVCVAAPCADGTTCVGGACVDDRRPELPAFDRDAGLAGLAMVDFAGPAAPPDLAADAAAVDGASDGAPGDLPLGDDAGDLASADAASSELGTADAASDLAVADLPATDDLAARDFALPPLTLTSIAPPLGPSTGGVMLALAGAGFVAGAPLAVTVNGVAAAKPVVVSATEIDCLLPAIPGALGPVPVVLTNGDGRKVSAAKLLSYSAGTLSYAVPPSYPSGGTKPNAIAAADYNGDGKLDLAVVDTDSSTLGLLYGAGDGSFSAGPVTATPSSPTGIVSADWDGDGRADLAIAGSLKVGVALGKGDGSFHPPRYYPAGVNPYWVSTVDVDQDGKLNLLVGNRGNENQPAVDVSVFLGNGDGSFGNAISVPVRAGSSVHIASGDLDRDGKLDLVVCSFDNSSTISTLLGKGGGRFGVDQPLASGSGPRASTLADFDGDGSLDVAVAHFNLASIGVGAGNGKGGFAMRPVPVGEAPSYLLSGDWNGDQKVDLAVALYGEDAVALLWGKGDGNFQAPLKYLLPKGSNPVFLAAGDWNGDGRTDFATANQGTGTVGILLGNPTGFDAVAPIALAGAPYHALTGDLNGDGKPDLLTVHRDQGSFSVMLGLGKRVFGPATTRFGICATPEFALAADWNGDGVPDLALACDAGMKVATFLNLGDPNATLNRAGTLFAASPTALAAGDLNGDGALDLVSAGAPANAGITTFTGKADGTFDKIADYAGNDGGHGGIVVGDWDGDGKLDVAVANYGNPAIAGLSVYYGTGDGKLGRLDPYATGASPSGIAAADLNGDQRVDLIVSNEGDGVSASTVSVLLADGKGRFLGQATYPVGRKPAWVVAGDWNNDLNVDLAVADAGSDDVAILLGKGDGSFAPARYFAVPCPQRLSAADLDGDGRVDLAIPSFCNSTLALLYNNSR